jgi:hypothetical protein
MVEYLSPEGCLCVSTQGAEPPPVATLHKADVYSFGVVVVALFARALRWEGVGLHFDPVQRAGQLMQLTQAGKRPGLPPGVAPEWLHGVVGKCLAPDPASRPSFLDLDGELRGHLAAMLAAAGGGPGGSGQGRGAGGASDTPSGGGMDQTDLIPDELLERW